jgi:hypothetical protein
MIFLPGEKCQTISGEINLLANLPWNLAPRNALPEAQAKKRLKRAREWFKRL